jgi:PAS domain S-box-containing protein
MPASPAAEFIPIFEKARIAIVLCDANGRVLSVNPACEEMLAIGPAIVDERLWLADLMPIQDRPQAERLVSALARGEQESFELETRTAGPKRALRWTAWKMPLANLHSASILAIGQPIGGDAAGQDSLRQGQRLEMLGRLASGVAHDVNNLLTGVLLYCDLLTSSLGPGHPASKYAEEIRNAGFQASGVVRQLLALAKPSNCPPRLLSLNEIAEGMKDLLTRLIGKHIALQFYLDPNLGLVRMDPTHVQQILLNLVLNARDALPQGGQVQVKTGNCKVQILPDTSNSANTGPALSCALLVVSDNGEGMDEATRARLFEPFFTTKGGKGSGLGLSTVHDIVRNSGGLIYVDSAPMKGTRVSVLLPLVAQEGSGIGNPDLYLESSDQQLSFSGKGIMP